MGTTFTKRWRRVGCLLPVQVAAVAGLYFLAGWLSQLLVTSQVYVCALWPSAGIGLAMAFWLGWRAYLGIFLGSFLANITFFLSRLTGLEASVVAGLVGLGAVLEAFLCRWSIDLFVGRDALLERFTHQVLFLVCVALCCPISALLGVWTAYAHGQISGKLFWTGLGMWWSGDVLGILLVTPLCLALVAPRATSHPTPWPHLLAFVAFVAALTVGAFFCTSKPFTSVLLLSVLWACFFFPQKWALATALFMSAVATAATTRDLGPLAGPSNFFDRVLNLNLFVFAVALTALHVSGGVQWRDWKNRELFKSSPIGIAWSNEETRRFTDANAALAEALGYDGPEDLVAIADVERDLYANPLDRKKLLRKLRLKGTAKVEFEAKKKNGEPTWLWLMARRVGQRGESPNILGFARDITKSERRKRCVKLVSKIAKLLTRHRKGQDPVHLCFQKLHEHLKAKGTAVWYVAENGKALERLWSQPQAAEADAPRKRSVPLSSTKPSDVRNLARQQERDLSGVSGGENWSAFALSAGGSCLGAIVVKDPDWLFADNKARACIQKVVRLIAAAILRYQTEAELARVNYLYQTITRMAVVGVFESDKNGETININRFGLEIEGLGEGEAAADWHKHLHPDCRNAVLCAWYEYVASSHRGEGAEEYKQKQVFGTVNPRTVIAMARAVRDDAGQVTGFVGVLTDISEGEAERERLEADRVNLEMQVDSFSHDTKHSVASIQHVLRQFNAGLLPPESRRRELIGVGQDNLQTLLDLAERVKTSDRGFSLHRLLGQFQLVPVNPSCLEKVVKCELPDGVPDVVRGPRSILGRVLQNLVSNAAEHGGNTVRVGVECKPDTGGRFTATFFVEDDGDGLTEEQARKLREELCQPLKALSQRSREPDSRARGRGLLLCAVELLRINSRLNLEPNSKAIPKENRFTFTLSLEECVSEEETPPEPAAGYFAGKGAVLLVEDKPLWQALLAERLLSWGVGPLTICGSGEEALALFHQKPDFALVLMDIYLRPSGWTGYKTAEEIRRLAGDRPRILSISFTEDDEHKRQQAKIDGFLRKDRLTRPEALARAWFPGQNGFDGPEEDGRPAPCTGERCFAGLDAHTLGELSRHLALAVLVVEERGRADPVSRSILHELKGVASARRLPRLAGILDAASKAPEPPQGLRALLDDLLREAVAGEVW